MTELKKIGKEILFLSTDDNCPRMGEGAFIKLNDSSIMLADLNELMNF